VPVNDKDEVICWIRVALCCVTETFCRVALVL